MLPPLFRIETLLPLCEQNVLILTPNQRLRRKILQAWGIYQQSLGKTVWQGPRIFALEQWFEHCWQSLQYRAYEPSQCVIASAEQERVLWESITADCGLMQPEVLAQQAASGLKTLERWNLTPAILQHYADDSGTAAYQEWCSIFQKRLAAQAMISREHSYRIIGDAFEQGVLPPEPAIHLVAFDDIPPLIDTQLKKASSILETVNLYDKPPETIARINYNDAETEMTAAAEWAKGLIETNTDRRIGIIVPNLGQCRESIERALINSFEGHSLLAETPRYTLPFNISAGTPLGDTPLIADALQILKLCHSTWSVDALCQLLFSPFWGQHSVELEQRCQLVTWLQSRGIFSIKLSELRYKAEQLADDNINVFRYFAAVNEHQHHYKGQHSPSQWVTLFLKQLTLMNWPGERQPDSHEYQQTQLWYQLFERFSGLDSTLGPMTASTAIQQLQGMANHQPFQAQVPDSPIQVLGVLEGAGLHFTHCWVLGLHQQAWPPAPAPNPLLPMRLQREYHMPHATSLRELEFAESLTQHYRYCASHIIFSYPTYDADSEQTLLPSQLIADIADGVPPANGDKNDFSHYLEVLYSSQQLETVDCHLGPAITPEDLNEDNELKGGASVIKTQSANPFDAFALYRLHARPPMSAVSGFSPIEQGNILHQALATIWKNIQTRAALIALETTELKAMVQAAINTEVRQQQQRKYDHLGSTLCQLEMERQVHIILSWLNFEKTRPPFKVVSIEDTCFLNLQGVKIKLRIDRVDQLEDGSYLILDYKTGESRTTDWHGDRPRDPQLPLYLIAHKAPVSGISFAQINVRKQTLAGLHNGEHAIKEAAGFKAIGDERVKDSRITLPEPWQGAKNYWQTNIEALLSQFLSGKCNVDYRDNTSLNLTLSRNRELVQLNRYYDKNRLKVLIK